MGTVTGAPGPSTTEVAHVCVVVVTYNSAGHLPALLSSLRAQPAGGDGEAVRLTVVVADNASTDDSVQVAAAHPGVTVVRTGGNLGYAAGINAALRAAPPADAVLVLNPDLVLESDVVATLWSTMRRTGAAVVVPQIQDGTGEVYPSLRREPTVRTALGDAVCGSHLRSRPASSSETVWGLAAYEVGHPVEWATGAALLVRREVLDAVGDWDEQFFLYSEETDFMRRVRDAGGTIWYEPSARVHHRQGGSGASPDLDVLLTVNRVRYARKHQSPGSARRFRAAVVLGEGLRAASPVHRSALRALLREASWTDLPRAHRTVPATGMTGTVIIPAHDEATVIGRTVRSLEPLTKAGVDIIVVPNGCTDATADIAGSVPSVQVVDIPTPSKTDALNAGDDAATTWPRLYLDADVEITAEAVHDVFDRLRDPVLAARPAYRWATDDAAFLVRRYYRARGRLRPKGAALWGAGAYAVSEAGHARFGRFPAVVADDVFVDLHFTPEEKVVVDTAPVVVHTPRTVSALLSVLHRQVRGPAALDVRTTGSTALGLARTVRGPFSLLDAAVYAGFALASRRHHRGDAGDWERDASTRRAK